MTMLMLCSFHKKFAMEQGNVLRGARVGTSIGLTSLSCFRLRKHSTERMPMFDLQHRETRRSVAKRGQTSKITTSQTGTRRRQPIAEAMSPRHWFSGLPLAP